jgi:predicted porin
MQKKIIAFAVAGLVSGGVLAQSNVTISGILKSGVEQYNISGLPAGVTHSTENRASDQSSRIIFSGSENLGNGLTALFQIDNRFSVTDGTTAANAAGGIADGNTYIALKSDKIGLFGIGKVDVHYTEGGTMAATRAGSLQSSIPAGIMSQVNGNAIAVTSRANNVVWYDSPNWGGITFRLGGSFGHAAEGTGINIASTAVADSNPGKGSAVTSALRYSNGPLNVGVSYWTYNAEGSTSQTALSQQRSWKAFGDYSFGNGFKVGLLYDNSKISALVASGPEGKRTAWLLPVTYTMGAHAFYAQYAKAGSTSGVNDSGAKQWMLGYDYGLSKRTSVGVYYTAVNNDAGGLNNMFATSAGGATRVTAIAGANAGADSKQLYAGVAHTF